MNLPVFHNIDFYTQKAIEFGIEYGVKIVGALAIFFIGKWIVRKAIMLVRKGMERSKVDETLILFAGNAIYVALMIAILMAAASNLGINTTSFVAVFGAAGLAIGLALKDTLSNVGAAVLIIFFRPFKVGDSIETAGVAGTVKEINLFSTTLATADNRSIIIPNGALISGNIINSTGNPTRRIDMVFWVDYKEDLSIVKEAITHVLENHPKVLSSPAPLVAIETLGRDGIQVVVRPWVNVDDYANVRFDVTEGIKGEFDKHHISVPLLSFDPHLKR